MPSMYAKLMSRITESSLMEEPITVRYCFMMMLAIADPEGYVIGTDVAIARRMNVPLDDFKRYVEELMKPDTHSNSQEEEGRRVILSDSERGYFVVNYRKYRDTRDEEQRRDYMRDYMRKKREKLAPVNRRKHGKLLLAQAEEEVKEEEEAEKKDKEAPASGVSERGLKFSNWFRSTLASDARISGSTIQAWGKIYDDLVRLDHRSPEEIAKVCEWARADSFWSSNFLSPSKLREKKDGVSYFDRFKERMLKPATNGHRIMPGDDDAF